MKLIRGLFLAVLLTMTVSISSNAMAADWPNNTQWSVSGEYSLTGESTSGQADTNMKIMLEEGYSSLGNLVHNDRDMIFNAYLDGNTTVNGAATFPITFSRYSGADLRGATMSATVGASTASTTSNASFTLNVAYNQGTYNPERSITVYEVRAAVSQLSPVPVNASNEKLTYGYHFRVSSPNVYKFGFIGGSGKADPTLYRVPFASVITGRGTYQSLEFDMTSTRSCTDPARSGDFILFDSDNEPTKNIQNGFAHRTSVPTAAENSPLGAGWTNYGGEYNALRMRLLDVSGGIVNPTASAPNDASNSWSVDAESYRIPVNTTSNINMSLTYSAAANSLYSLQLNPLGIANFVALGFPFDEDPGRPCIGWDVVGTTTRSGGGIVYKDSGVVTFKHNLTNLLSSLTATNAAVVATRYVNGVATSDTFTLPSGSGKGVGVDSVDFNFTPSAAGSHCEYISFTPVSESSAGPLTSAEQCVYVIDPVPTATDGVEYEKNATAVNPAIEFAVNMGGGYCPPAGSGTVVVTLKWTLNLPTVATGTATGNWGNGVCNPIPATVDNLTAAQAAELNSSNPGQQYSYTAEVVGYGIPDSGNVTVIEVPFARFYGNDIYATTAAGIRFNDSYNTDAGYDDRGSVSQYAAISFGAVRVDTSAFRTLTSTLPTQPTNGLDSPNSQIRTNLAPVTSTSVYNEVIADLPSCPNTTNGNVFIPNMNGCYYLNIDASLAIPRLGGALNPLSYDEKITIVNQDASKPLMIDRNIENSAGANVADPVNSAVLLIISAGDIYIDRNVQRIDAILVAGGDIYTCGYSTSPTYGLYNNNQLHQSCRKTLTINGALSAKNIHFQRAVGSRLLSTPGVNSDLPNGYQKCAGWQGVMNCNVRNYGTATNSPGVPSVAEQNNSGAAAEIINFPAYLYFASPYLQDNGETGAESDALFQAPPRL